MLASSGADDFGASTIKLWDTATGTLVNTLILPDPYDFTWSVAFDSKGLLASAGRTGSRIKLWDTATGTLVKTLLVGQNNITDFTQIAFDSKGLLASGSQTDVYLWKVF